MLNQFGENHWFEVFRTKSSLFELRKANIQAKIVQRIVISRNHRRMEIHRGEAGWAGSFGWGL